MNFFTNEVQRLEEIAADERLSFDVRIAALYDLLKLWSPDLWHSEEIRKRLVGLADRHEKSLLLALADVHERSLDLESLTGIEPAFSA